MNPNLELMPFQEEGSDLLAKSRRCLLVWDAGVGKTPTAVRGAVKTQAARVLVFCPPIATGVWRDHFRDWSEYRDIRVYDTRAGIRPFGFMEGQGVRIVAYSRLREAGVVIKAASKEPWDAVILDECHYLKNPGALRTRGVYGPKIDLAGTPLASAKHIWALSGTPILNHAAEFWTHLHALAPDTIILPQLGVMGEGTFTDRFCHTQATPYGVRILGSRNSSELADRVKPFANRKRMRDVLPEMPELRIVEHPLPADTFIEKELRRELASAILVPGFTPQDFNDLDDDELLAAVQAGAVGFSTVRRLIGRAKVEGVATLANDFLEDNEDSKLILFAHHQEVIRDLADTLKAHAPRVITGATSFVVRENHIKEFQNDPKVRLIILAIEAAGEVITLHAAHNVIIAEPSPVPAKNLQAIARAHRKGQKHPVLARFVLLPGTLDARLMSIVARKTREIAQIVDGAPGAKTSGVGVDFPTFNDI